VSDGLVGFTEPIEALAEQKLRIRIVWISPAFGPESTKLLCVLATLSGTV
jgi:hypothetical protein